MAFGRNESSVIHEMSAPGRHGIGSHRYKAVFVGTPNGLTPCAASSSGIVSLTVTRSYPTKTPLVLLYGGANGSR